MPTRLVSPAASPQQLDEARYLAACPSHALADAFRYAAGPTAGPVSAAVVARQLDPLLDAVQQFGPLGAEAAALADPLLRRLAGLGPAGLTAARSVADSLKSLAGDALTQAGGGDASGRHGGDDSDAVMAEPPACVTKHMLEELVRQHTGKDTGKQRLSKRKLAAMLPPAVYDNAVAAALAAHDELLASQQQQEQEALAGAANAPPQGSGRTTRGRGGAPESRGPSFRERVRWLLDGGEKVAKHLEAALQATTAVERSRHRGARLAAPLVRRLQRLGPCGGEAAEGALPLLSRMARHGDKGIQSASGLCEALSMLCTGHEARLAEGLEEPTGGECAAYAAEVEAGRQGALLGTNASEVRLQIACNGVVGTLILPPRHLLADARVAHGAPPAAVSPTEFEALASGRTSGKRWRNMCRVVEPDGMTLGVSVAEWMREHVEPEVGATVQLWALSRWRHQLASLLHGASLAADALDTAEPGSSEDDEDHFRRKEARRANKAKARLAPRTLGSSDASRAAATAATALSAGGATGWAGLAGMRPTVRALQELTLLPLLYPEVFAALGASAPRGVLLHGPPGCGKTQAVRSLVSAAGAMLSATGAASGDHTAPPVAFFSRRGADCLGKYSGEAERTLRLLFEQAAAAAPSVIFFDEFDGLAPVRGAGRGDGAQDATHASVVSTLLALMDGLDARGRVIVVAATNRPDAIDPALRRPGRFDRELYFPLPGPKARAAILKVATRDWSHPPSRMLRSALAAATVGFAGADLRALTSAAVLRAIRRAVPHALDDDGISSDAGASGHPTVLATPGEQQCAPSEAGPSPSVHAAVLPPKPAARPPVADVLPRITVHPRDWRAALAAAPPPCSARGASQALAPRAAPVPHHLVPVAIAPLAHALAALARLGPVLPAAAATAAQAARHVLEQGDNGAGVEEALTAAGVVAPPAESMAELLARAELVAASLEQPDEQDGEDAMSEGSSDDDEDVPAGDGGADGGGGGGMPSAALLRIQRSVAKQYQHGSLLRILVCGASGRECGQSVVSGALLGVLSAWPVHSVSLATIVSLGAGDPTSGAPKALAEPLRHARQGAAVLHLPAVDAWAGDGAADCGVTPAWRAASALLPHGPGWGEHPCVVVATCRWPWDKVPQAVGSLFDCHVEVGVPDQGQADEMLARLARGTDPDLVRLAREAGPGGMGSLLL